MPDREDFKPSSLCWACANSVPSKDTGCAWSRSKQPVEGWNAQLTELKVSEGLYVRSYFVTKCPEYAPDQKMMPKEPVLKSWRLQNNGRLRKYFCPTCQSLIGEVTGSKSLRSARCRVCGQRIKWIKEDNSNGKNDV